MLTPKLVAQMKCGVKKKCKTLPVPFGVLPLFQHRFFPYQTPMAKTEYADYKFTVKEFEPGSKGEPRTFLACEPVNGEFAFLEPNKGFLSIQLNPGIDVDEANEIARYLQERVSKFAITIF